MQSKQPDLMDLIGDEIGGGSLIELVAGEEKEGSRTGWMELIRMMMDRSGREEYYTGKFGLWMSISELRREEEKILIRDEGKGDRATRWLSA